MKHYWNTSFTWLLKIPCVENNYMTEKLWRSLDLGLVPVVYGGLEAYKSVLPPTSYIEVADLATPKLLAYHLLILHTNTTLYRGYFLWKYNYYFGWVSLLPEQSFKWQKSNSRCDENMECIFCSMWISRHFHKVTWCVRHRKASILCWQCNKLTHNMYNL